MMRKQRKELAWIVFVTLLFVVGCGTAATPEPPTPAPTRVVEATAVPEPTPVPPTPTPVPPTPTDSAPSTLTVAGIYTTTITADDPHYGFEGDWELEFTPDGMLYLTWKGGRLDPSPFEITQDQMEFGAGPGCGSPWSYRWTLESGVLTFAPVGQDPCLNRQVVLSTHPLAPKSGP